MKQAVDYLRAKHNGICGPVCSLIEANSYVSAFQAASDSEDRDNSVVVSSYGTQAHPTDVFLNLTVPNQMWWSQNKYISDADPTYCQTLDHFWDADDDPGGIHSVDFRGFNPSSFWADLFTPDDWDFGDTLMSAQEKARIHWENARYFYETSQAIPYVERAGSDWISMEGVNIGLKGRGSPKLDLDKSMEMLGRVLHLLQDMTVPTHAHNDVHPQNWGDPDPYEHHYLPWAFSQDDAFTERPIYNPSLWYFAGPTLSQSATWTNLTGVDVDAWRSNSMSGATALHYLFFASNQAAQFFASKEVEGNRTIRPEFPSILTASTFYPSLPYQDRVRPSCLWVDPASYSPWMFPEANMTACYDTPKYLYTHAVLATAALLEVFERDVMHLADVDSLIATSANSVLL
jgi:hypothetical protein